MNGAGAAESPTRGLVVVVVTIVIAVAVPVAIIVVVIAVMFAPLPVFTLLLLAAPLVLHVLIVAFAFPVGVVGLFNRTVGLDVGTAVRGATDDEWDGEGGAEERTDCAGIECSRLEPLH